MRALAILLSLAMAGPAVAQPYLLVQAREAQAAADADAARYREITLTNQIAVLEAHLQTDQALSNLQAARAPALPPAAPGANAPPPILDARQLTSIPDDLLAQSNARIRAAAANRH